MPHFPKPFFKEKRQTWYVQLNGHQINLGPDEEAAFKKYHELMARPEPKSVPTAPGQTVVEIIDKYLEWCQEHRKPKTYQWYRWRLQRFAEFIGRLLTVEDLKPYHLDDWLATHPNWVSGMKHGACKAVQRAMRWAERRGRILKSPLAGYEKPRASKRTSFLTLDEYEALRGFVRKQSFRDLVDATWYTGCRPQELQALEARHVDLTYGRWVFPANESKGESWPRVIYLTDKVKEITERLMKLYPTGPLFRNEGGKPWTPFAVNCAFCRLQIRMGRAAMKQNGLTIELPEGLTERQKERAKAKVAKKHAKKYCLYMIRHSWATHALAKGVDALTVAILLGHRDPSTLAKVYSHLTQKPEYLQEAAKKAVN